MFMDTPSDYRTPRSVVAYFVIELTLIAVSLLCVAAGQVATGQMVMSVVLVLFFAAAGAVMLLFVGFILLCVGYIACGLIGLAAEASVGALARLLRKWHAGCLV